MAVLSLICGLVGCKESQKSEKHALAQVTAVSISCGHMDRSYGYSFWAHKEDAGWMLDAECFTNHYEVETVFQNRELDSGDVEALFAVLEQCESVAYVENASKKTERSYSTTDETVYSFCLNFSDGKQYVVSHRQNSLEELFYRLAEKYNKA